MEEDIKFLEKMVKEYKQFGDLNSPEFEDTERIFTAIRNLIARYKEVEEFKKQVEEIETTNFIKYKNYIPKTKVKVKKEELETKYREELGKNSIEAFILKCNIGAYEELLEES